MVAASTCTSHACSAYLGNSTKFDNAIASFAKTYADQTNTITQRSRRL
jgi:hypothetical protein